LAPTHQSFTNIENLDEPVKTANEIKSLEESEAKFTTTNKKIGGTAVHPLII